MNVAAFLTATDRIACFPFRSARIWEPHHSTPAQSNPESSSQLNPTPAIATADRITASLTRQIHIELNVKGGLKTTLYTRVSDHW